MVQRVKPSMGCGYVVTLVILGVGVGLAGWAPHAVGRTIGAVLVVAAVVYLRFARKIVRDFDATEKRRAALANQPWLWRKEWSGSSIASEDSKGLWLLWLFAVLWNGVSLPAVFGAVRQGLHEALAYLVFLFPLVGAGIVVAAIYKTTQRRKYGRTRFVPATMPGVIGGCLGGVIEVPARIVLTADARVALRCVRRVTRGSGDDRRTTETVLWEREELIPPSKWASETRHTTIPVLFDIPAGSAASDPDGGDNEVVWRLSASAKTPGVDFKTLFVVPVFVTSDSTSAHAEAASRLGAYREGVQTTGPVTGTNPKVTGIERTPDGFRFGSGHLRGARWVFTAISAGLLGFLGVLIAVPFPWFIVAAVGVFVAVVVWFAADLWFDTYELSRVGDEIRVRAPRFLGHREWRMPSTDVVAVRHEESMSIGTQRYFRLVLVGSALGDGESTGPREPFRARKLRYRLSKQANADGAQAQALRAELSKVARFEVTFAGHVPGPGIAEGLEGEVLAWIKAKAGQI